MKNGLTVAVVGATGAVGREVLLILAERNFPAAKVRVFASERSAGERVDFAGASLPVETVSAGCFDGVDIAIFSAGAENSRRYTPQATDSGAVVVDNSSAFRMDDDVPLVVPEINGGELDSIPRRRIIANPNCTTTIAAMAIKPLHDEAIVTNVIATSFQSVSGAGARGMLELQDQISNPEAIPEGTPAGGVFPAQIALNVIPQVDVFLENGYTREEMKLNDETAKIMGADIKVSATAVRVPVMRAHAVSMSVETKRPVSPPEARGVIDRFAGIKVTPGQSYPMPVDCSGKDDCFAGRIRRDITAENRLCLWVVGDQLRKGAALNSVQIAELVAGNV